MNKNDLYRSLQAVDDDILERSEIPSRKRNGWVKWGLLAACICAVLLVGSLVMPKPENGIPTQSVSVGGILRNYRMQNVVTGDSGIEWPWEYKTVFEQYTSIQFRGETYRTRGRAIRRELLGAELGIGEATGYDIYSDQEHSRSCTVYQIQGIREEEMLAVELDDSFCVFMREEYSPPADLGEFLDSFSLEQNTELVSFTRYKGFEEQGYYSLEKDDTIWQILSECRNAPFLADDAWGREDNLYISFSVSSEALGVYKKVLYISEEGYLKTNLFEWGYVFDIGRDAAEAIMNYAAKHAQEAEFEPYTYTLSGTLTTIGEGYLLIDDSILCADKNEGMIFKVLTDDLRISRCIDFLGIKEGDFVQIQFTNEIDAASGNVVSGAYSLDVAMILDGEVIVED